LAGVRRVLESRPPPHDLEIKSVQPEILIAPDALARPSRRGSEPEPVFITVAQATRRVSLSVTTLYKAFARGELTRYRAGGKVLLKVAELNAWVTPSEPDPKRPGRRPKPSPIDAI
jgi:excisionase family DNA binding protein